MAYQHVNWVRDHSQTTGAARMVLWAIASRADPKTNLCFPGRGCLARDTALSERNVARSLKNIPSTELEVIKGGSPKGGKRQVTRYRVLMPGNPPTGDNTTPVKDEVTGDKNGNDPCQDVTSTGDKNGKGPVSGCHPKEKLKKKERKAKGAGDVTTLSGHSLSPAPVTTSPASSAFVLSQEDEEELNREFPRLRPVRSVLYRAAKKCAEDYPNGGPMRVEYFRRYLEKAESDLDPTGLIEGKKLKAELRAEADRDREESEPSQPAPEQRKKFTRDGVPIDENYWARFTPEIREKIENDHIFPFPRDEPQSESLPVAVPTPPAITRPVLEQPQPPEELLADSKSKNPEIAQEIDELYANLNPWDAKRFKKEVGRLWDEHHRLKKAADDDEIPKPSVPPNRTVDDQQPADSPPTGDSVTPVEPEPTSDEPAPIDTPQAAPIVTTGAAAFNIADMLAAPNK